MVIDNKFGLGDFVYLKTDDEQKVRMITQITIMVNCSLQYQVTCGHTATDHYDFEISAEENELIKVK